MEGIVDSGLLTVAFWTTVLASGLRLAVSVGTAALGEMISERGGVLNLGLEGVMLFGGFAGFVASLESGSPYLGLFVGLGVGALVGLVLAVLVVVIQADQVVTGLALTLVGIAFTAFLNREFYGGGSSPPRAAKPETLAIPGLSEIPVLGESIFSQSLVTYIAIIVVIGVALYLRWSYWTIVLDAVGEAPHAADAAGHSVVALRTVATVVGSALGGLAGALLVVGQLGFFNTNITAGRGFIAIALVIFGGWRPLPIFFGAVLFGSLDALQFRFQTLDTAVPFEFFIALPFIVTLVALMIGSRSGRAPSALAIPFLRDTDR